MRTILVVAAIFAIVLLCTDIAVEFVTLDPSTAGHFGGIKTVIEKVGTEAWDFGRPLLQLVVVLLILEWVLARIGIKWNISNVASTWSIQTFIAVVVISTFCLAILSGLAPVDGLKDITLIVIGFYFGTRARREASPLTPVATDPAAPGPSAPAPDTERNSHGASDRALPPEERRASSPHTSQWGQN